MPPFHHSPEVLPKEAGDRIDYPDEHLRAAFRGVRHVAVIGFKQDPGDPSHAGPERLRQLGYRVIPVSPELAGEVYLGEIVPARVVDIPLPIEMVEVFGGPKDAEMAADGCLKLKDAFGIKTLWLEPGARNDAAARKAEEGGLIVVMNRSAPTEAARLRHP